MTHPSLHSMSSTLPSVHTDGGRYRQAYQRLHECCNEHQGMRDFFKNELPDIMSSALSGKSVLNVIAFGSGSGHLDLDMLSAIHLKYPEVTVANEVVEPSTHFFHQYKDLVSQTPGLDYINCSWKQLTVEEFEKDWKENETTKKVDLIHMFQMLYYVKDFRHTISFLQSLLNKNGKLLISIQTGDNGWSRLEKKYYKEFAGWLCPFSDDVKRELDAKGQRYQSYCLPSQVDITECFNEGDKNGDLILDLITEVLNFRKSASAELKAGVLEMLGHPDCSVKSNGKIMLDSSSEVIVIDLLI
ncbi:histamine N-methyltransferase-like [Brachionichthys hirsutus]|uniref:histamine N-methyltransferase-like n=1 Tax=Brachionichthys hirsutus TaxID=412623 RepID=UPI003604B453